MAIYNQRKFDQSLAAGFDGFFDWDFILPAFKDTKIEPMDFDAVVERHGCFLAFETKNNDSVEIPWGQVITLESVVKNKAFVIIVLKGKSAYEIDGWQVWYRGKKGDVIKDDFDGNYRELISFVRKWFLWADQVRRNPYTPDEAGKMQEVDAPQEPATDIDFEKFYWVRHGGLIYQCEWHGQPISTCSESEVPEGNEIISDDDLKAATGRRING